jgi:hypothetical protein
MELKMRASGDATGAAAALARIQAKAKVATGGVRILDVWGVGGASRGVWGEER